MTDITEQVASYPDRLRRAQKNSQILASAQPEVMEGFGEIHKADVATRALDRKTKELMALAISIVVRCDDCIPWHINDSLEAGATRDEIADALGVAILMGGGPAMIYVGHATEAMNQFFVRAK